MAAPLEEANLVAAVDGGFSGVVSVHQGGRRVIVARGLADRATGRPIRSTTRFAAASAAKTFTALVALRLVEAGTLELSTRVARLVPELSRVPAGATVQHLLEHTSGLGDYLPEDDIDDIEEFLLPIPTRQLATPGDLLPLLDVPAPAKPGEPFRYNNGGYVLLAIVCERASGCDWFDLVQQVFDAAAMA